MTISQQVNAIYEDGVLKPLEPLNLAEHQRVRVSVENEVALGPELEGESFFDAANRLGILGCIKGTPRDLSTNLKHMEGFGKNGA
jgi:predicted DNA-binding antitoxin AbrB/MazE fold protein